MSDFGLILIKFLNIQCVIKYKIQINIFDAKSLRKRLYMRKLVKRDFAMNEKILNRKIISHKWF